MLGEKKFVIKGRSRRKDIWAFNLINLFIGLMIGVAGFFFFKILSAGGSEGALVALGMVFMGIMMLVSIAMMIAGSTQSIRRFHDIGLSGWYILTET